MPAKRAFQTLMVSSSQSQRPRLAYHGALVPAAVQRAFAGYLPEWITADRTPVWLLPFIGGGHDGLRAIGPYKARYLWIYNDEIINCCQGPVALYIRHFVSWADIQRIQCAADLLRPRRGALSGAGCHAGE